ncbi:MAG: hypothetical protein ACJA2G_002750 [Cognaticolwellia sp.]|jgi:hypothetical protein
MRTNLQILIISCFLLAASGCASTRIPYEELGLDTTTDFNTPSEGKAGIYVYQFKTGIFRATLDVGFEIKNSPEVFLNTGEYLYFEIAPGEYEYKSKGGLLKRYLPVKVEANQNYFFVAWLQRLSDNAILVTRQKEINAAKRNILSKRYEEASVD